MKFLVAKKDANRERERDVARDAKCVMYETPFKISRRDSQLVSIRNVIILGKKIDTTDKMKIIIIIARNFAFLS